MAHGCKTLQHVDETPRPLFGLSMLEAGAVFVAYALAHKVLGHTARGVLALAPPLALWGVLVLTHKVRVEPRLEQMYGYLTRRALGWPRTTGRPHAILEVDGFTRDALTPEQQDLRLIGRLQGVLAGLGAGGAIQLLVTNDALDASAIVTEMRARHQPLGRTMARLGDRQCERLGASLVRASDLRFYAVIYEPSGWRPARLVPLPFIGRRGDDDALLDDLVAQVRATLQHMGLSARVVPQIADVAPDITREHMDVCALSDGRYAASLYMLLPPGRTDPGWLDALVTMPGPYRLAVWVHGLDSDREITRLEARQRHNDVDAWVGAMKRASGARATTREALDETDEAILRLRQPGQGLVRCGVYVTVVGTSETDARRRIRRAALLMKGPVAARPATATGHQWPLYQSTRPGKDVAARCWRMDAATAANAYPFNRGNPSTRSGFEIGTSTRGELVRLDPTDASLRNALAVIFGLSGMGKSFLGLKCVKEWLLMGNRVTVLDRSGHYEWLRALAGGVTVTTAEELGAVPQTTRLVIVDLRAVATITPELRAAVDRRVQTPYEGQSHCFVIEEAWQLEHLDGALWVNDLARRGRHFGLFVLWVTHDPDDLLHHPVIKSMFSAAAIKIAFALDDKDGVASKLGSAMGLTPREIETVKALRRGEAYLMRHSIVEGSVVRGVVQVSADDDEKWLFASDPRTWQYQRREQEVGRHDGNVAAAVMHLADTLSFDDDEVPV